MLLTICLSDNVKRNPIFINFIIVTVIYSALLFYSDITMFSSSAEMEMVVLKQQQNALTLVASIALLHLLIHVYLLMRSAFKKISPKALDRIQIFLIITPYVFGILPLAELFLTTGKFTAGLNYFQAALSLVATGFDGALLIRFYKYRQILRHYELEPESILTKATLIRVTLLCFFRLIITLTGLLSDLWDLKASHTTSPLILLQDVQFEKVFEFTLHIYPLITLCIFIQMDVLTIWFPCLRRHNTKYVVSHLPF